MRRNDQDQLPKLQRTTVTGLILNGNQTISVQQSLCAFHIGLGSGQLATEELADGPHTVTISLGIGGVQPKFKHHRTSARASSEDYRARPQTLTSPFASNASIKAAPEPVKLIEGICERCSEVGSRFVVQPIGLD
jgi:hypothetical protein